MHNNNQRDSVDTEITRALSALRSAAPPNGMEARILERLDTRLLEPQRTSVLSSVFLRGAFTGALVATAACAALFFALRTQHSTVPQTAATTNPAPVATPVALHTSDQCSGFPSSPPVPHPGSAAVPNVATTVRVPHPYAHSADGWDEQRTRAIPSTRSPHLISASFAPSRPAPPAPPTAQERALAQLARNASPALLASLSPAAQQKADAKRQSDFDTFFAPSAAIRKVDEEQKQALGITDDDTAAPTSTQEGSL